MRRGSFAQCELTRLSRDFRHFGLIGDHVSPGVVAQIDQHAAAVRDSIGRDGIALSRGSLTHYLRGFMDGVRERGWHSSETGYDWETLRLLAICRLAEQRGFLR